ncbi:MAG: hypothetical protein ACR2NN_20980 [Bryobacteraceae bacterium]
MEHLPQNPLSLAAVLRIKDVEKQVRCIFQEFLDRYATTKSPGFSDDTLIKGIDQISDLLAGTGFLSVFDVRVIEWVSTGQSFSPHALAKEALRFVDDLLDEWLWGVDMRRKDRLGDAAEHTDALFLIGSGQRLDPENPAHEACRRYLRKSRDQASIRIKYYVDMAALQNVEKAPDEAALVHGQDSKGCTDSDPVATERKIAYATYKSECKTRGVTLTQPKFAKAACPTWNDKTPIYWWISNDPRSTQTHDILIRNVLRTKPHLK